MKYKTGDTAICPVCGQPFTKVGRKTYCGSKCQQKAWGIKNYQHCLETHRAKNNRYYQRKRNSLQELKLRSGCAMCGYNKYAGSLDYHHIDPDSKEMEIRYTKNYADELSKCILLCSNCHREVHNIMRMDLDAYWKLILVYQKQPVQIGNGTKIWKLCNILPGAKIGENCSVGAYTEIGQDVIIGDRCKIQSGVFIPKGVTIGNDVFIGPHVIMTNDRYPSAKDYGKFESTVVEDGANIGAGTTIRCGVKIGSGATIGAGSVVTKDVPPNSTVYGNPAKERV